MNEYEVSIDSLINELIIYNQDKQDPMHKEIIQSYYSEAYKSLTPINIVDGKTLQFGNNELQNFINKLSNKYVI